MGEYELRCLECGMRIQDTYTNRCPRGCDALLMSVYADNLRIRKDIGIWKFYDWLPVRDTKTVRKIRTIVPDTAPVTYLSDGLGKELGISNLYISFNGFWPERCAFMRSCTFKELEAICTLARVEERTSKTLVLASAGNTARSFAQVFSAARKPVVLVVPSINIRRVWTTVEVPSSVILVSLRGDYTDAIRFASHLTECSSACDLINEGGVRNIARRDGLGIIILDALLQIRRMPDHYFQAVGSGVGAIGVYEMAYRACRRFTENSIPHMHLAQNLPFAPMFSAWRARRNVIIADDMRNADACIKEMYADVLSNKNPPYSIKGGVYDVLSATDGEMYGIKNSEARAAQKLFECVEGIDIDPAASIAVAALVNAVERGIVKKNDYVLLNITGGGYQRLNEEHLTCLLHKTTTIISADPSNVEDVLVELQECLHNPAIARV